MQIKSLRMYTDQEVTVLPLRVQWLLDKISKVLLLLSRILSVYLCNSIFSWESTECLKGNIKLVTHMHLLFENNHINKTSQKFIWKLLIEKMKFEADNAITENRVNDSFQ